MNTTENIHPQRSNLNLQIKQSTLWAFLFAILFKVALDLAYYLVVSNVWGYAGFHLNLNSSKLIESYLLFFIIFVSMPKSSTKLSSIFVWLLVLLSYLPMLTYFAFADEDRIYMYAVTAFWLLVFLLLRIPVPDIHLPSLKQAGLIYYSLFICLGIIVFLMVWKYLGLSFNFDLTGVYETRAEYKLAAIPLAGYLFSWMAKVINPVFFALFILKRKWFPAALVVILQLLLFSATGHKVYFLALPFVLALMWIITRKNALSYMTIGLFGVVLLGILSYWLIDDLWISSLLTRRALLVPAQISFYYYDFFSQHELVYLATSRLGSFSDYPYLLTPPHLIGELYFGNSATNANTGITGDAYMNFGLVGLALYSMLLAIILKLLDSCSKRIDLRLGVAAIAVPAISLTNGALTTAFLTGGLWLAILLLYLLPKEDINHTS